MKKIALILLLISGLIFSGFAENQKLKVGVTAGPHEQILGKVKELAAKQGIDIDIVVFTDYILPNLALDQGDIDINSYQHEPFLNKFNADRGTKLVKLTTTVNFPMALYSKKIKKIDEIKTLKSGAQVGIPNDPTNGGRALLLLESAGVIKLKPGLGVAVTVRDITDNPYKIKVIELEASQIYQHLDELAFAAINTNFAIAAGLVPTKDSIFLESPQAPYVNVIAARAKDKDNPLYQKFIAIYKSQEVKTFIANTFAGSVITAW